MVQNVEEEPWEDLGEVFQAEKTASAKVQRLE